MALFACIIYVLVTIAYLYMLPIDEMASLVACGNWTPLESHGQPADPLFPF